MGAERALCSRAWFDYAHHEREGAIGSVEAVCLKGGGDASAVVRSWFDYAHHEREGAIGSVEVVCLKGGPGRWVRLLLVLPSPDSFAKYVIRTAGAVLLRMTGG